MKVMHVHAKSSVDIVIPQDKLALLPKCRWGVVTTIQHEHKIGKVIDQLKTATLAGQVLGCNAMEAEKIKDLVDAWLFVGSGIFHPIQVALKTGQDVWLWNPVANELNKMDPNSAKKFDGQRKAALSKFILAKTIGIIVSTKIGQKNFMRAKELVAQTDKECFIFACDTIDDREFENFSFVDMWVNTACPRLFDDKPNMVNIDHLIDAGVVKLTKEPMAYEVPIWKSSMGLRH